MTDHDSPQRPQAPITHRTPTRPGQPGTDKRRTDPNPNRLPAKPPYPHYEDDPVAEKNAVDRDRDNR